MTDSTSPVKPSAHTRQRTPLGDDDNNNNDDHAAAVSSSSSSTPSKSGPSSSLPPPVYYGDKEGPRTRNRPRASRYHPWLGNRQPNGERRIETVHRPAAVLLPLTTTLEMLQTPIVPLELPNSGSRRGPKSKRAQVVMPKSWHDWSCEWCGTNTTPQRRHGPKGKHSMCNACGQRYSIAQKEMTTGTVRLASRNEHDTPLKFKIRWKPPITPPAAAGASASSRERK